MLISIELSNMPGLPLVTRLAVAAIAKEKSPVRRERPSGSTRNSPLWARVVLLRPQMRKDVRAGRQQPRQPTIAQWHFSGKERRTLNECAAGVSSAALGEGGLPSATPGRILRKPAD